MHFPPSSSFSLLNKSPVEECFCSTLAFWEEENILERVWCVEETRSEQEVGKLGWVACWAGNHVHCPGQRRTARGETDSKG